MTRGWTGTGLLLSGYGAFLATGQTCPLSLFVAVVAVLALLFRGRVEIPRLLLLPVSLVACLLMVIFPETFSQGSYFVGPASAKVAFFLSLLLTAGIVRKNTPDEEITVAGLALAVVLASGLTTELQPYLLAVVAAMVFLALASRQRFSGKVSRAALLAFVPALLLGGVTAKSLKWVDRQAGHWLQLFSPGVALGARFPPNSRLSSIQEWQTSDALVLRVFSDAPPGYLVGRCYLEYSEQLWRWKSTKKLIEGRPIGLSEQYHFQLNPRVEPEYWERVEFPGPVAATTLFMPRDAVAVRLSLPHLHHYQDDEFQTLAKERFDGVYEFGRARPGRGVGGIEPGRESLYLQLPDDLTPEVGRLADMIIEGKTDPLEKAAAVESYLQENFTYGFGYPFAANQDPLEEFLVKRPPAHCEFFATSMTLMMRHLKIPSRYVTGFVVQEQSLFGDYYVVRAKHAHAWVEVYIGQHGWVRFDPTPPGVLGSDDGGWALYQGLLDAISYRIRKLLSFLSLSPGEMLAQVAALLSGLARSWVVWLLAILAGCYLGWRQGLFELPAWSGWARRAGPGEPVDELGLLLQRFEAGLSASGYQRACSQTLFEFAAQLKEELNESELEPVLGFLDEYCRARYGQRPETEKLRGFLEQLQERNWVSSRERRKT